MSDELEVLPPEPASEEEGGGPVKSFLEHLEDLRWTLIKCAAAILIGIIVCLSASDFIIGLLKWPLDKANSMRTSDESQIVLTLGTNVLAKFDAKDFPIFRPAGSGTNGLTPPKPIMDRVRELFHPDESAVGNDHGPKSITDRFLNIFRVEGSATNKDNRDVFLRLAPVTIGTNTVLAVVPDLTPPKAATDGMQTSLAVLSPGEAFTVAIQIAIYGGFTLSAPFVILFLGQFILPALHIHEKRFLYKVSGFASGLFLAGVAFCYFVMMIITLSTTVGFANWLGFRSDTWRASEYISFMCWFLLGMGISFELPLVLLTLVKIGILDAAKLSKFRMYWVVAGLTLAGFITPDGNPLTMVLMFLPLHLLYEISVIIAWWWERQERLAEKRAAS